MCKVVSIPSIWTCSHTVPEEFENGLGKVNSLQVAPSDFGAGMLSEDGSHLIRPTDSMDVANTVPLGTMRGHKTENATISKRLQTKQRHGKRTVSQFKPHDCQRAHESSSRSCRRCRFSHRTERHIRWIGAGKTPV